MPTSDDIAAKAKEYLGPSDYTISDIDYVPDIKDSRLTFGNTGLRLTASVLYIDMRGSTDLLLQHHRQTVAKIQKAYLHIAVAVVSRNGGQVRSFNGDGILAFFPKDLKPTVNHAVTAAMEIAWMLSVKCKADFERYHSVEFGIGVDHGELLVTKVGIGRDENNNDLSWIGLPVNTSVRLGDKAGSPYPIRISETIYINLDDDNKYANEPYGYSSRKVNMWVEEWMDLHGTLTKFYKSSWHRTF